MAYESKLTCPECGENKMMVYRSKTILEGLLNIVVTAEKAKNLIAEGEIESDLEDSIGSMKCENCGNVESKLDQTVSKRSIEAE